MKQLERLALIFELSECERRAEQLKARLEGGGDVPEKMRISDDAERARAQARIDALERRCQEILDRLWPVG